MINFVSIVPFKTRVIIYLYIYLLQNPNALHLLSRNEANAHIGTNKCLNSWHLSTNHCSSNNQTQKWKKVRNRGITEKKGASSVTPETWHLINVALPGGSVLHRTSHRFVKRSSVMFCLRRKAALNCQICTMKKKYDAQLRGDWRVSEHVINIKRRLYTPRWHFRAIIVRRKM